VIDAVVLARDLDEQNKEVLAYFVADENFDREGAWQKLLDGGLTETQINEAMGDMRYEALKRITLINEPIETALKSLPKNIRTKFKDTFEKVLTEEGLDSYGRSYLETLNNYVRENEGADSVYDVDIGKCLSELEPFVLVEQKD
jgi:L-alanine-DL-glutamate epimerase-like enolase superfamily enzyme